MARMVPIQGRRGASGAVRLRITRKGFAEVVIGWFAEGWQPGGAYEGFEPPKIQEPDHRLDLGVRVTDQDLDPDLTTDAAAAVTPETTA